MTRTAPYAYVRVSRTDPHLDTRGADLRRDAESRAWDVAETFREGIPGRGTKVGPEFERCRASLSARSIEGAFVTKLDRLARSVPDALAFFELAETDKVRVLGTTQQIDTDSATWRLIRTILAGVREFEAELLRERTRAAMAVIKNGRKHTRTGWTPGRPRNQLPAAVARVGTLLEMSHSWPQIAQLVGLQTESIRKAVWPSRSRRGAVESAASGETVHLPGGDLTRD